ncbi:MAG: hypothetical protein OXN89_20405 [Bryobacterales bacterium]|nr:hypothetical protein [Bryobacterales bacterium]
MISDLRAYEPIPTIYRVFVSDCSKDSAFRIAELGPAERKLSLGPTGNWSCTTMATTTHTTSGH